MINYDRISTPFANVTAQTPEAVKNQMPYPKVPDLCLGCQEEMAVALRRST